MRIDWMKLGLVVTFMCWVYCLMEGKYLASKVVTTGCLAAQIWMISKK